MVYQNGGAVEYTSMTEKTQRPEYIGLMWCFSSQIPKRYVRLFPGEYVEMSSFSKYLVYMKGGYPSLYFNCPEDGRDNSHVIFFKDMSKEEKVYLRTNKCDVKSNWIEFSEDILLDGLINTFGKYPLAIESSVDKTKVM